ncbi:MAG: pantetheine-phosphate adenylyltransferase [Hyphomicrobiales bacterium]
MRVGFYAGSFDPVTNGHMDVISRAMRLVDRLVVGVGVHHDKTALLPMRDRVALLEKLCIPLAQESNCDVEIMSFDTLAVDAAHASGAGIMVRGLRDMTDFAYEIKIAQMNKELNEQLETVFLAASADTRMISSSAIKQIADMGGDISPFVPELVRDRIKDTF